MFVSFPQFEELISPHMSPQALHQWREEIVEALYFVAILLNIRSAQADIDKRSYNKSYQEDSPETVGAQGGVLGDGVIELLNLQGGGDEPKLKGWTNQTNLLERQHNSKETWCRCASALNPRSCLKGVKSSAYMGQTKHVSVLLDYSLCWKNCYRETFYSGKFCY